MEASGIHIEFTSINSKAFDVSALTLGQGQEVIASIPSLEEDNIKWLSDNDPCLEITKTDKHNIVKIKSLQVGQSEIQIQSENDVILKEIIITVINDQATTLGFGEAIIEQK